MKPVSGSLFVELRGAQVEVIYRREAEDIDWWFAQDSLNDMPLRPHERRDIRREVLGDSRR